MTALCQEATLNGRNVEMVEKTDDGSSNHLTTSMTFGLAPDVDVSNITVDTPFPLFFLANRQYNFLMVKNSTNHVAQLSGGTTPGGTELFSSFPIIANGWTAIPLNFPASVATNFFLHHGGSGDGFNGAILRLKTLSDPLV